MLNYELYDDILFYDGNEILHGIVADKDKANDTLLVMAKGELWIVGEHNIADCVEYIKRVALEVQS